MKLGDGKMLLLELLRGQVVQAAVRPDGVVVATPGFDDDLGFGAQVESFERQALVAELALEAVVGAVLPRLARIDQRGADAGLGQPLQDRPADELRAVVRAHVARCAMHVDQAAEHLDDAPGTDRAASFPVK